MRSVIVIGMLVAPALACGASAAEYWLGYSEMPAALGWHVFFTFGILYLIGFVLVCMLGASCLAMRQRRLQAILMVVAFWPLLFLCGRVLPSGGSMVVRGLRDRVIHDYTVDDLRRFGREVDEGGLIKVGWINHGDISELTDTEKETFHRLQTEYPFMHWLNDGKILAGPSLLNGGDDRVVEFEWGGPMLHWGCSIRLDGHRNDPPAGSNLDPIHVSDDIYFYDD